MDRGARGEKGEEGRERRNRCKKIVDAKMRFAKTRPVFPCAAHANSFTRVPGRNAAVSSGIEHARAGSHTAVPVNELAERHTG